MGSPPRAVGRGVRVAWGCLVWMAVLAAVPASCRAARELRAPTETWSAGGAGKLVLPRGTAAGGSVAAPSAPGGGEGDDNDFSYNPRLARILVNFQSVAYCHDWEAFHDWNCNRCSLPGVEGFQVWDIIRDQKEDLLAYVGYAPTLEATLVVFRGTDGFARQNWIDNLHFAKLNYTLPGAPAAVKIHSGFYEAWAGSELKPNVTALLRDKSREWAARQAPMGARPRAGVGAAAGAGAGAGAGGGVGGGGHGVRGKGLDMPIIVLGHSLGGAMAVLAALEITVEEGFRNVTLYTYGCPRVGNTDFADFFWARVPRSIRITHNKDIVPSLPYERLGFHHVAQEVFTYNLPIKVEPPVLVERVCDLSGEDPTCQDAACFLGLCTSVKDHLHYLEVDVSSDGSC